MAAPDRKYQKIPNLYRAEAQAIFALPEVVAMEKVDGTNFSFGYNKKGFPVMNSRNNVMWVDKGLSHGSDHILQFDGYGAVKEFQTQFPDAFEKLAEYTGHTKNIVLFGEFYGPSIQKRINYGSKKKFLFFDAFAWESEDDEGDWLTWREFKSLIEFIQVPMAHVHYQGPPKMEIFSKLILKPSEQARLNGVEEEQISEGLVIKGLHNEKDNWGERLVVKYKSDAFAEKKGTNNKKVNAQNIGKNMAKRAYAQQLADTYVTESRLENCLEKMRSESKEVSIKIMRDVIKYMQEDVMDDLEEHEKTHEDYEQRQTFKEIGSASAMLFKKYLGM